MIMAIPSELKGDSRQNLTVLTHVLYGLHTLSWFSAGLFAFIAIIINYVTNEWKAREQLAFPDKPISHG